MAASVSNKNNIRRTSGIAQRRSYTDTYIDGNAVRHLQAVPEQVPERRKQERRQERTRVNTRRNRERALSMSVPYVAFLAAASITSVCVCIGFLKLQAEGISYRNQIASLESSLSEMKLANDNAYENAISSVDMEQVKEVAINELGMVYADEGQIITYSSREGDYIHQYAQIPME